MNQPNNDTYFEYTYGVVYGNYGLILPRDSVSRVVENYQVCPLPSSTEWFLGMANIDGLTAPIFDLNLYLLNEKKLLRKQHLLVIGKNSDSVAITVDQPPIQAEIDLSTQVDEWPKLPEPLKNTVNKCYSADLYWLDIDFKKFFMDAGESI